MCRSVAACPDCLLVASSWSGIVVPRMGLCLPRQVCLGTASGTAHRSLRWRATAHQSYQLDQPRSSRFATQALRRYRPLCRLPLPRRQEEKFLARLPLPRRQEAEGHLASKALMGVVSAIAAASPHRRDDGVCICIYKGAGQTHRDKRLDDARRA